MVAAFRYCGIEKILTGEWDKPEVTSDTNTQTQANEWELLDAWIALHLNLSDSIRSQVRHLTTSFAKWQELQQLFKPVSLTSEPIQLLFDHGYWLKRYHILGLALAPTLAFIG